jgi:uncharacterized membrane protein YdjX (TVP38/TMEM64 family)
MDRKLRSILKGLILIATLVGVVWGVRASGLGQIFDTDWADHFVKGQGLHGRLLFLALAAAFTGVGLPRQVVSFIGGYAFGILPGTLLALAGTLLGCCGTFFYARWLGQGTVNRRFAGRIAKINAVLSSNPFLMTLIIRFLPVGSNVLTNLVAGVSRIPASWFLLGSLLGFIPQTFIFALLGSGVRVDATTQTVLAVVLFVLSVLLGWKLYRKYRMDRAMNGD